MDWLIISPGTGEGFLVKPESEVVKTDYLVARHSDEASALDGIARAQRLEQQLRPMWLAAIEHERRLANYMISEAHAAARPIQSEQGETE